MKTTDENGTKVFINVVGSPVAVAVGGWERGEIPRDVKAHLERPTPSKALPDLAKLLDLRPLVGAVTQDADHSGRLCTGVCGRSRRGPKRSAASAHLTPTSPLSSLQLSTSPTTTRLLRWLKRGAR